MPFKKITSEEKARKKVFFFKFWARRDLRIFLIWNRGRSRREWMRDRMDNWWREVPEFVTARMSWRRGGCPVRRQDTLSGPAGGRADGYIEGPWRHRKGAEGAHVGRLDLQNGARQCLKVSVCLSESACQEHFRGFAEKNTVRNH